MKGKAVQESIGTKSGVRLQGLRSKRAAAFVIPSVCGAAGIKGVATRQLLSFKGEALGGSGGGTWVVSGAAASWQ